MTADDRFARTRAFEREVLRRCSTRVEASPLGTGFLNERVPRLYSSNLLWVAPYVHPRGADPLLAEADRILGGARLAHRALNVDGEEGRALANAFLKLGWFVSHLLVMTLERPPDRPAAVVVEQAAFEEARPLLLEVARETKDAEDDEVRMQLVERKRVLQERVGARFLIAHVDGRPAAVCDLYAAGGVAQIEDVNTLEAFRGRGAARALVISAAEIGRSEGADLCFLVADADDWPKSLYGKLGFDAVGSAWEFVRVPPGVPARSTG